jgi:hypothetical protein
LVRRAAPALPILGFIREFFDYAGKYAVQDLKDNEWKKNE